MQKIKWERNKLTDELTIMIVAKDLVRLYYPFIESFISAMPLGCNFIIGNANCTDSTMECFTTLSKYAPVTIHNIPWLPDTGGTAIGIATQRLLELCPTKYALNLQANEVLCEDAIGNLKQGNIGPSCFMFRHFWGGFKFDGSKGYGYGHAPRIYDRETKGIDQGDGAWPHPEQGCMGWPIRGTIHRYSYCFGNQVEAKASNHYILYRGHAQTPEQRKVAVTWCSQHPNYDGTHPEVVHHFLNSVNYEIMPNWTYLSQFLVPL